MAARESHRGETVCWNSYCRRVAIVLLAAAVASGGCRGKDAAGPTPESEGAAGAASGAAGPQQAPGPAPSDLSAEQVLAAMVKAYHEAPSYGDQAIVRLTGTIGNQPIDVKSNCLVALERPNKVRLQIDHGVLVADGKQLVAFASEFQGQVLRLAAPQKLTIPAVYPDYLLAASMMQSPAQTFSWVPLQLVLLLADDPLKTLLDGVEQKELLEPAKIDQQWCDRVEIRGPAGRGVFWIDRQSRVLRRFEFPTVAIERSPAVEQMKDIALVAEYRGAQLGGPLDPTAFQFETASNVAFVEKLVPPVLTILGQPMPQFEVVDAKGNKVTGSSLSGKTVVLEYWQTTSVPCRQTLPAVAEAYARFKDDPKVVFLAVSLDGAAVENATLEKVLADWKVALPVYRDRQQKSFAPFRQAGVPLTIVVGPKGVIQGFLPGRMPNLSTTLGAVVKSVREGQQAFRTAFEQFRMGQQQFQQVCRYAVDTGVYRIPAAIGQSVPRTKILPRTEPESFRLAPLWSCQELDKPGNILVVGKQGAASRLLVVNGMNSIAELSADGKLVANHALKLVGQEPITFVRTAVDGQGKRLFLVSAPGVQHVYLLDDQFNTLLCYPDAPHAGIGDARLVDLQGDGNLRIVLGYFDVVGVQAVSLEGTRLWANRSLVNVLRIAPLAVDKQGHGRLLCLNGSPDRGSLVELDFEGKRLREIVLPDRSVGWVTAADLDGDGRWEVCALAQAEPGKVVAVGVDPAAGKELWSVAMPAGIHQQQIEAVTSGRVRKSGPGVWILAAADSTLQFVSIDGRVVDHFAYGAELAGVATARLGDRLVLVVATPQRVEAWAVEPRSAPLEKVEH